MTSATLDSLSDGAERFFWRLTLVADDLGRFEADPRILLAKCFPLKVVKLKLSVVTGWWMELIEAGTVKPYRVDDKLFGYFPGWAKHQRLRNTVSKYPDPETVAASCGKLRRVAASCGELPLAPAGVRTRGIGIGDGIGDGIGNENKALSGSHPTTGSDDDKQIVREHAKALLSFLNEKTGKGYRPVETNLRFIRARLESGASVQDCKTIIVKKTRDWKGTAQEMYLRPETLFNATKFESYLGEISEPPNG